MRNLSMNYFTHPPQVVPSADSHQSEYIAPCDARRGLTHVPSSACYSLSWKNTFLASLGPMAQP